MRSLYTKLKSAVVWAPIRVSLVYFTLSFFWILFSDRLVLGTNLGLSTEQKQTISMLKGWMFVLISTGLIFQLIRQELKAREKIEEEIVKNEQRFKAIFSSAGLGMALVDLSGRIIEANYALAEMTGYFEVEMNRMSVFSLVCLDDVAKEELRFANALKAGSVAPIRSEKRLVRKDGTNFFASVVSSFVFGSDNRLQYVIMVCEDITEAKDVDRAKSEFVTLASHQLRTPLTIVGWYTEALSSGSAGKLTAKQQHYFDRILDAQARMVRLVSDLLNVSRIETGRFVVNNEITDATKVVSEVMETLQPITENRLVHFDQEYGGDIKNLKIGHNLLNIILQNLLSNAIKYSRPEGWVKLSLVNSGQELDIMVADNGFGIPKNYTDKMFKKFSRADNIRVVEPDGTGLGLYMVKSLVEQVHGKIWYESVEGQGSTFHVVLPLYIRSDK